MPEEQPDEVAPQHAVLASLLPDGCCTWGDGAEVGMYLAMCWAPVLSVIRTSSGAEPKLLACQVAPNAFCMVIHSLPCTRT